MPITPENRQRLADLMDTRRQELDKLWQDVARDGGISLKALHTARTGGSSIRPSTRRSIEKGLRWERASVDRIMEGGDPAPLAAPEPVPDTDGGSVHDFMAGFLTDDLERFIWDSPTMSEAERLTAIRDLRAKRAELRAELHATEAENDHGLGLRRPPRLI